MLSSVFSPESKNNVCSPAANGDMATCAVDTDRLFATEPETVPQNTVNESTQQSELSMNVKKKFCWSNG
jgi:hypothetical protein